MRSRGLVINILPVEGYATPAAAGKRDAVKRGKGGSRLDKEHEAAMEVARHRTLMESLTTLHRECSPDWDWEEMRLEGPPAKPPVKRERRNAVLAAYKNYQPGFWEKFTGKAKEKKRALAKLFDQAEHEDAQGNKKLKAEYDRTHAEWTQRRALATRVVARDAQAYYEALKTVNPFGGIAGLGRSVSFCAEEGDLVEAEIAVYGEDELPQEVKMLSKSGQVATREMPHTMLHGMHGTHVCSSVLRVAREIFALLPVDTVIVTATAMVLNTQTGHSTNMPVLSAAITRRAVQALNFLTLDPMDAMDNFAHRMDFKKIKGFGLIVPLEPADVE